MTKLFRDEISMIEAVEVMSRRIEALERDKRELQELFSTQFDRSDEMARDHRSTTLKAIGITATASASAAFAK